MYFKNDVKVRIEDSKLILTYSYKDHRGETRDYGKQIEICKDMPMGIIDEFLEQCVIEIALWRTLFPGTRQGHILDGTRPPE